MLYIFLSLLIFLVVTVYVLREKNDTSKTLDKKWKPAVQDPLPEIIGRPGCWDEFLQDRRAIRDKEEFKRRSIARLRRKSLCLKDESCAKNEFESYSVKDLRTL